MLQVLSIFFQVLIVGFHPFEDRLDHWMSFFNEAMVSLYLYLMFTLTDFNTINPDKDLFSWALLFVIFATVFVNLLKMFFQVGHQVRRLRMLKRLQVEWRKQSAAREEHYRKRRINYYFDNP